MTTNQLSRDDIVSLIISEGAQTSFMVRGQPGIGKTSIARDIQRLTRETGEDGKMLERAIVIVDCTLVSEGDVAVPVVQPGGQVVRYAPNEMYLPSTGLPPIIVLDEFGKAMPNIQAMFAPLILERRLFNHPMPEGTFVIATTNLETDNVGEQEMKGHTTNRLCFVELANPTADEWASWFQEHGSVSCPEVIAFAVENPALFHCYTDPHAASNTWIYNPSHPTQCKHYVSPRSLASAALTVANHRLGKISHRAMAAALAGKIGASAAALLTNYAAFARDMPRIADIVEHGAKAAAPTNSAQHMMLASSLVAHMTSVIQATTRAGGEGKYTPEERDAIIANVMDYIYGDKEKGVKARLSEVATQLATFFIAKSSSTFLSVTQKRVSDAAMQLNAINRVMTA